MGRKPELTVWGGVIMGMSACQQSNTPLTALGNFLGRLRRKGWHPVDVRSVELCVLELLGWKKQQEHST